MIAPLQKNILSKLICISLATFSIGCTVVGPDYERPSMDIPDAYKESADNNQLSNFKVTNNAAWWLVYNDSDL
ncbi:hypothetical protein [Psychromonas sp. MME2]